MRCNKIGAVSESRLSGVQLIEQRLGLFQREPAVDRSEKIVGLVPFALSRHRRASMESNPNSVFGRSSAILRFNGAFRDRTTLPKAPFWEILASKLGANSG
jgi:hypothetical protein